jgi:MFS family permease
MTRPRRLLAAVSTAHALDHVYLLALPPLLAPLMDEFGTGLLGGGAALTWLYLMSGLWALPAGWLADRVGPRRMIAVFLGGAAACLMLAALAPDLKSLSVILLFLGIFCGLYHPAGLSLISKRCTPVGRAMGIHGIGGSLGLSLGPLVAAQLAVVFGWRGSLVILATVGLVLMPVFALSRGDGTTARPAPPVAADPVPGRIVFWLVIGCQAFAGFCYRGILTFLPVYFSTRTGGIAADLDPVATGGFLTTLSLAVGMAGQYAGGWLSHRYVPERLYAVLLAATLPFPLLMGFGSGGALVTAAALFAFFFFAAQPVSNLLVARHSGESWRSFGFGISFTASFGIGSLAAPAGGWIAERLALPVLFPAMGAVLAAGVVVALVLAGVVPGAARPAGREPRPPSHCS